jgi:hypothetical protein
MIVVPGGTLNDINPAVKRAADIFVSNGTRNPSVSDKRLKGPAAPPGGITNVINVVIIIYYFIISLL